MPVAVEADVKIQSQLGMFYGIIYLWCDDQWSLMMNIIELTGKNKLKVEMVLYAPLCLVCATWIYDTLGEC